MLKRLLAAAKPSKFSSWIQHDPPRDENRGRNVKDPVFISTRPLDYLTSRGYQVTLYKTGGVFLQSGSWGQRYDSIRAAYLDVRAKAAA